MTKFIAVSDLHAMARTPEGRKDDYFSALAGKLDFIAHLANKHQAHIIQTGDIIDSPSVADRALQLIIDWGKKIEGKIFYILGNHDIKGIAYEEWINSKLGYLTRFQEKFIKLNENSYDVITNVEPPIFLYGADYKKQIPNITTYNDFINILVTHDDFGLQNKDIWTEFGQKRLISTYPKTEYDIHIQGHYHLNHEPTKRDNTWLINPGALMRMKRNDEDLLREPRVALIEIESKDNIKVTDIIVPHEKDIWIDKTEATDHQALFTDLMKSLNEQSIGASGPIIDRINAAINSGSVKKEIGEKALRLIEGASRL